MYQARHFPQLSHFALAIPVLLLAVATSVAAQQSGSAERPAEPISCKMGGIGSPYIPVDNWIYPAVLRLYSLGYLDSIYLGMRPWTRTSLSLMLQQASNEINDAKGTPGEDEAEELYDVLLRELQSGSSGSCLAPQKVVRLESVYSVARGISGTPLRDSYHLGSTIVNDYGRLYANGFSNYSGAEGYAAAGRFVLYLRGEFHGVPSTNGYSASLSQQLSIIDETTDYFNPTCWLHKTSCTLLPLGALTTIPYGSIATTTNARILEGYVSAQLLNHVVSFGKQDSWLGPGMGGAMAYSNNAENIYSFGINRIEPLRVPLLSRLTGPFRYEFLVGSLKGHVYPQDPWMHLEKLSFRPTKDLEFGFERTVIWGGKGHEPITVKSFLRSFFSLSAPSATVKDSPQDPGARFGAFDFSYRLPFVRNWLTLYADTEVHDDVSPIDAPRRAAWRPGVYLSHTPGLPKLDLRLEGISTDPPVTNSSTGRFMYWEELQRQGYTNNGQLLGDWIGREDKGGQGWITYHLTGNEWIQAGFRSQKAAKDFIPGGTTLNDVTFQAVKRIGKDFEINANFTYERWKAPIYLPGQQTVTNATVQLIWYPNRNVSF